MRERMFEQCALAQKRQGGQPLVSGRPESRLVRVKKVVTVEMGGHLVKDCSLKSFGKKRRETGRVQAYPSDVECVLRKCIYATKHEPTSIYCPSLSHLLQSRSLSSWASVVLRPFPRADWPGPRPARLRGSCLCFSSTFRRETPLRCMNKKRRRQRMCWHLTG